MTDVVSINIVLAVEAVLMLTVLCMLLHNPRAPVAVYGADILLVLVWTWYVLYNGVGEPSGIYVLTNLELYVYVVARGMPNFLSNCNRELWACISLASVWLAMITRFILLFSGMVYPNTAVAVCADNADVVLVMALAAVYIVEMSNTPMPQKIVATPEKKEE